MDIQWSLVLFTALSGAGAWLFACVGINTFKGLAKKSVLPASLAAVALLAVGGLCSVTHLSHPERMLSALGHPAPGIFLEALLLGILAVVALVYAVLLKREASMTGRKVLAVIGIVLAVVFSFSCGSSYMMASQASWNTVALPLGYLGTAAASGTAVWTLMTALFKEDVEAVRFAGRQMVVGGALALVLALAYGMLSGVAGGSEVPLFWIAVVACGGLAPAVFGWLIIRDPGKALTYSVIALTGALIGSVAYRALMWLVGSTLMALFGVVV